MKEKYITAANGTEIELGSTNIDDFFTESAPSYMEKGHHIVRVAHYELIPEKTVKTRTDLYTTKPYILLDLADKKTGEVTTTRLYSAFVPYFLDGIAAQTDGAISRMKLSEVLKYLGTHDFSIWVTYDKEYGVQVNYREPRNK